MKDRLRAIGSLCAPTIIYTALCSKYALFNIIPLFLSAKLNMPIVSSFEKHCSPNCDS